jgi:hypothetical protein
VSFHLDVEMNSSEGEKVIFKCSNGVDLCSEEVVSKHSSAKIHLGMGFPYGIP